MLPLVSSERVLSALRRLGCYEPRRASGSHQPVCRNTERGRLTSVVKLAQHEVKRGTLAAILRQLDFSEDEFVAALR
jgi:predicted RNA binding protein YcfA (HicA-like mRNA interferase family)